MACRDWPDDVHIVTVVDHDAVRRTKILESLLCSASRSLERLGYDFAENPELDRWWDSHKAKDEERRRDEDRKREAERLKQEQLDAIMKKPFCDITKQELRLLKQSGAFG